MQPDTARRRTETSSSSALWGTAVAACHSFLLHQREGWAFDPTDPALHRQWHAEGEQLRGSTFDDVLTMAARAWPIEMVPQQTDVAVSLPSGRVYFFGEPLIMGDQEEEEEEEEERIYLAWQSASSRPPPLVFHTQDAALTAADAMPPGFLWVWARDKPAEPKPTKQYLVASLDDFWAYYFQLPSPATRCYYELIRTTSPVCFYADLEYELHFEANQRLDPTDMVRTILETVVQLFPHDEVDPAQWIVLNSSSPTKVSFHVLHPQMLFENNHDHLKRFAQLVQARIPASHHIVKSVWNAATREHEVRNDQSFLDGGVYSCHRVIRVLYATKLNKGRPFLPMSGDATLRRDLWQHALVQLPRFQQPTYLYVPPPQSSSPSLPPPAPRRQEHTLTVAQGDEPLSLQRALGQLVERHYRPDRMRQCIAADDGVWTFSMVLGRCDDICHDTHNNNVYAVADLRLLVHYAKCHAQPLERGPAHPLPRDLPRLVDGAEELQPGAAPHLWIFPADSRSARVVLAFCKSVFGKGAVPALIPAAANLVYDSHAQSYSLPLGNCPTDAGTLTLTLEASGTYIRCAGGTSCSAGGWRLERPSRSSAAHGKWDLTLWLPSTFPTTSLAAAMNASEQEAFLAEPNFYRALGVTTDGGGVALLYEAHLKRILEWATHTQLHAPQEERNENHVHELAARVEQKASVMRAILTDAAMEMAYRECLVVDPGFEYPLQLLPGKRPVTLLMALFVFLSKRRGYKRVGDAFCVPTATANGQGIFYKAVPADQLLSQVCQYERTPNLCTLLWRAHAASDLERMLKDETQWPTVPVSKRYLGFSDAVYDLEENVAIPWDEALKDPTIMPFNSLDRPLPLDVLEEAKRTCPTVSVTAEGIVHFEEQEGVEFVPTPLYDGPLADQGFDTAVRMWKYAFFGRMFHRVGKSNGDNWEVCPSCQGAPSTFKSSDVTLLQSYLQPHQFGVLANKTEQQFPVSSLRGKLMVFLTETGDCNLDRELLKQMVSGDPVSVTTKFKTAASLAEWDVPMWSCGNRFLAVLDPDGSVERRYAVFPYTRVLPVGAGDTGLVARILEKEQVLLLIKSNTLYLHMRKTLKQPVHSLLPPLLRKATRQAVMQNDSLRSFLTQEYVVEESARTRWSTLWDEYMAWSRRHHRPTYTADPHTAEVQTMLHKLGAISRMHRGELWLRNFRRRTASDPPYESVFTVQQMRRAQDDEDEEAGESPPWSDEE